MLPSTFTTGKTTSTHTHEISTRTPDYIDIFTLLLPTATFLAGYYLNSIVENSKEKKRLYQIKQYFLTLATSLESAVNGQAQEIQDAIGRIQEGNDDNLSVSPVPDLRTTRIRAIPDLDLYKVFIADKKNTAENTSRLINLSSALDFIDEVKSKLDEINTNVAQMTMSYVNTYNADSILLAEEHSQSTNAKGGIMGMLPIEKFDPYYRQLNATYALVAGEFKPFSAKNNINNTYNHFIKPLYELTRNIEENAMTDKMLYSIIKLNGDYLNYTKSKELAKEMLGELAMQLLSIGAELKGITKYFRVNP